MKSILIIEDDTVLSTGLQMMFASAGYAVTVRNDGREGYLTARMGGYDLVLVDWSLPGMDGIDVCRELRAGGDDVPVIMLTSHSAEEDKVLGLEEGADDYITKPFGVMELTKRVEAVLRRSGHKPAPDPATPAHLPIGTTLVLNTANRQLTRSDGSGTVLSAKEHELLLYFINNPNTVHTRQALLRDVWGYDDTIPATRTVDVFVRHLRTKIEPDPAAPRHLITVTNAGYKFLP